MTRPRAGALRLLGMLALAWLSLFAASLLTAYLGSSHRAAEDRKTLSRLEFALEDFYLDTGRYPLDEEGFAALVSSDPDMDGAPVPNWAGPYLDLSRVRLLWSAASGEITDLRGHPIFYHAAPDQEQVLLISPGPDGALDTTDADTPDFDGIAAGDDILLWVEGPALGEPR